MLKYSTTTKLKYNLIYFYVVIQNRMGYHKKYYCNSYYISYIRQT